MLALFFFVLFSYSLHASLPSHSEHSFSSNALSSCNSEQHERNVEMSFLRLKSLLSESELPFFLARLDEVSRISQGLGLDQGMYAVFCNPSTRKIIFVLYDRSPSKIFAVLPIKEQSKEIVKDLWTVTRGRILEKRPAAAIDAQLRINMMHKTEHGLRRGVANSEEGGSNRVLFSFLYGQSRKEEKSE